MERTDTPFSQDEVTLEHNRSAQIVSPASVDELESAIGPDR